MRIGVVTTSYPRTPGDPSGSFVAGLAHELVRRGHELEVVAAGEPGAAATSDAGGAIPVTRVPTGAQLFYDEGAPERLERSWLARLRAPLFTAALTARVGTLARRWDAVLSHWLVPSGLAAAATRKPHVAVAHSADVHLLSRRGFADVAVGALLAGGPLAVLFAGEHLRARLVAACSAPVGKALAARARTCPMGVDVDAFASLRPATPDPVRGRPLIGFVGRLVPIKGVDVLLDAAEKLGRPAQLVVAGAGPEREPLERRAKALSAAIPGLSIRFAGEVRGSARDALLAAADVMVVPSLDLPSGRGEGTPVVALEALAAGVPLVASDVGGVRAACGGAALYAPPGDPEALAAALSAVVDDHAATVARVREGRALAARHDWRAVGARVESELLEVSGAASSGSGSWAVRAPK